MKALWLGILTVREAILKGTLLAYFIVGNLILVFLALAISASVQDGVVVLSIFGQPFTPPVPEGYHVLDFLLYQIFQSSLSAIILLGVFATAGLIPSMLEKGTVELYLSKPLSRSSLLLSRAVGACGGIAVNILYFALGIWLLFGIKAGIWPSNFVLASAVAGVVFFFYYSVVALVAVISRSTGFSIMFAFLFSFFSSAMELREQTLFRWWDNPIFHRFLDALYYATPQLSAMDRNAASLIMTIPFPHAASAVSASFSITPFIYSFLAASFLYGLAIWYFSRQDY